MVALVRMRTWKRLHLLHYLVYTRRRHATGGRVRVKGDFPAEKKMPGRAGRNGALQDGDDNDGNLQESVRRQRLG